MMSRGGGLAGRLGDLAKTALADGLPFLAVIGRRGLGLVAHNPHLAGPVGHKPRRAAPAAPDHTANVASISRRRGELTGGMRDLAKTALSVRVPHPWGSIRGRGVTGGAGGRGGVQVDREWEQSFATILHLVRNLGRYSGEGP
jgi:hypothetical protein